MGIMKKPFNRHKVWGGSKRKTIKRKKLSPLKVWGERVTSFWKREPKPIKPKKGVSRRQAKTLAFSKSVDSKDIKMKVLKPKQDYFVKQAIKSKININNKPKKKFSWGHKDLANLSQKVRSFSFQRSLKNLNYYVVKWKIGEQFSSYILKSSGLLAVLAIFYLSFFDTFFLIKTYTVEFEEGSYLSEDIAQNLVNDLKSERIVGIFPNNQLWFINSQNVTLTAKNHSKDIEKIEISNRSWPNQAGLRITTKPTLLTLNINDSQYWRIGIDGSVISEDTAEIKQNVVYVQRPVFFDTSGANFADYPLQQNEDQLNRIYFIDWLWKNLENQGVSNVRTELPSLQDTDVSVTTEAGTTMLFNSEAIQKELQLTRLRGVLANPEIAREFNDGVIEYIDFRIPKKIFICYKNTECST